MINICTYLFTKVAFDAKRYFFSYSSVTFQNFNLETLMTTFGFLDFKIETAETELKAHFLLPKFTYNFVRM